VFLQEWGDMQRFLVGYGALIKQFNLSVMPAYCVSYVKASGSFSQSTMGGVTTYEYPKSYMPASLDDYFTQLEFALKHEGVNLEILQQLFLKLDPTDLTTRLNESPTGKYTRIIWFLYEFLLDELLPISACKKVAYIDLLDSKKYFTATPVKSARHGINNNLLGNAVFCPIIRKTKNLTELIDLQLEKQAEEITERYDEATLARATTYLFTKETKSSFAIEHESPNQQRVVRFVNLLQRAGAVESLNKESLIACQNVIVDSRFADVDYRASQNYVGESLNQYLEKVHYISPKPEDLTELMEGWFFCMDRLLASDCPPVVAAAAISFGFVFLHPFEDGNGRLHRFLIHYFLAQKNFTPAGIIFPVSAVMLANIKDYDRILESFSRPLLQELTAYRLDNDGVLTVDQESKSYYQFIDYTRFAEYLFDCVRETVEVEFDKELAFLARYDKTKKRMEAVVAMPDKLVDLLIRCLLQNDGRLSEQKRKKYFEMLSTEELNELLIVINETMEIKNEK
jgi:hypothetical protein